MNPVFIFWDNSNIFISAKTVATEREGRDAHQQVRIEFNNLLRLASADRKIEFAIAVGSIPPEMREGWKKLEATGITVKLFERGQQSHREQAVDEVLQVNMLRKALDYASNPGVAVALTGDGRGFFEGAGFHADLERMYKIGWGIEVLAWEHSCNPRLKWWSMANGIFIPLENYYESVTFRENEGRIIRRSASLSLTHRPKVHPKGKPEAGKPEALLGVPG